ncbi:MAG: glycosyltransferase family 9 protein, partial [Nitrospirae bacterium]|nr:glycosyltransferase family 9 protein [Nitrospirota bacterium]
SDLFIGVDSAPMHIAAAVGTPVIALFGPTKENRWGPWGNIHTVISKAQALPCKPCKSTKCKGIALRSCMEAISPGEVKRAIEQIINKHSEFT